LRSGSGTSLNLGKGFVENLGDIEQTNNVSVVVADGLFVSNA
jgi:hypothetical protein